MHNVHSLSHGTSHADASIDILPVAELRPILRSLGFVNFELGGRTTGATLADYLNLTHMVALPEEGYFQLFIPKASHEAARQAHVNPALVLSLAMGANADKIALWICEAYPACTAEQEALNGKPHMPFNKYRAMLSGP